MYSKQEASAIKRRFWTSFGQYMKPVASASGEKVNWLNYKTGVRNIFFRMDANNKSVSIAIEITHADPDLQKIYMDKFLSLRKLFEGIAGEGWNWAREHYDEHGMRIGRISKELQGVNIFNETDWPAIISFLKPALIAIDEFWNDVKEGIFTS